MIKGKLKDLLRGSVFKYKKNIFIKGSAYVMSAGYQCKNVKTVKIIYLRGSILIYDVG